jgi:hypothetical protein
MSYSRHFLQIPLFSSHEWNELLTLKQSDVYIPIKDAILTEKMGKPPSKSTFSALFFQQNPKHGEKFKSNIRAKYGY